MKIHQQLQWYLFAVIILLPACAVADSTGMPWEGPMQKILDSLTGPVAQFLGVVAIVISGFGIAFGEAGSGIRRLFQVVFGLSIAFTASSLLAKLFGVTG